MSKYIKTPEPKTEILKVRLDYQQKNELIRIAERENKTITRVVLEAIKDKRKKFPI
jgi:uncharacterized protein (DUF1778 family)